MTETINATTDATATIAAPKPQQTATITLNAHGSVIQLVAERRATGARTYVITTDAAKKSSRGMTENHATFEAAKAATEKMAKAAEKGGWQRKAARRGFVAKPDAFSTLPSAPKAKK
jgi:hypothetical protein